MPKVNAKVRVLNVDTGTILAPELGIGGESDTCARVAVVTSGDGMVSESCCGSIGTDSEVE